MNLLSHGYSAMPNPIRPSMDTLWLFYLFLSTLLQLHINKLPMFHTRAKVLNLKHYIRPIPLLHHSPQLSVRNVHTEFHDNSTDGLVVDTRLQTDRQRHRGVDGHGLHSHFFFFFHSLRNLLIFPTECIPSIFKHTLIIFNQILNYVLSNEVNMCSLRCTKRISYSTHLM